LFAPLNLPRKKSSRCETPILSIRNRATTAGGIKMESQDFKGMQDKIQTALVAATRTVNQLGNEDLDFQRIANPSVGQELDDKNERLLQLANGLLTSAGKVTGHRAPSLDDAEDIDLSWKGIVDVIDSLLEKADTCLDEYTGLIKRKEAPTTETVRAGVYQYASIFSF
jgi:exosome complex exonuclease RRP6